VRFFGGLLFTLFVIAGFRAYSLQQVTVPDPRLEAVLRIALKKPVGVFTSTDFVPLNTLTAQGLGITNLAGLEAAGNLVYLDLSGNEIADIRPIVGLTRLRSLYLNHNQLTNVPGIGALKSLDTLVLDGGGVQSHYGSGAIADLSPISGLTNLTMLSVAGNPLTGLSISNLPNLNTLEMSDCGLSNITFVAHCFRLTYLDLNVNHLADITPVAALTNLSILQLRDNRITDLSPLCTTARAPFYYLTLAYNDLDLNRESPTAHSLVDLCNGAFIVEHGGQNYSPRLHLVTARSGTELANPRLEFDGDAWSVYAVESSTNCGSWQPMTEVHALSLQPTSIPVDVTSSHTYYRLRRTQTGVY